MRLRLVLFGAMWVIVSVPSVAQHVFHVPIQVGQDIYTPVSLPQQGDSLHLLITGAPQDSSRKGVMIFIQGSLPRPLVIRSERGIYPVYPFSIPREYHVVILGKPGIPWELDDKKLKSDLTFRPDSGFPPATYQVHNHMEYYVEAYQAVIDFLIRQPWVDSRLLVVAGHSQGARVAVRLAKRDSRISHVGFLSGNPQGRIEELIRRERIAASHGNQSAAVAQQHIEEIYQQWSLMQQSPTSQATWRGDTYHAWTSFSEPVLEDLISLDQPVWVGYGTADVTAAHCDVLPLRMQISQAWKLAPYPGLDHNFFELNENGLPNYERGHWHTVITDFLAWVEEISGP
ncbi:MAG: alpha/beta hydrolase [Bacteroidota bacterium]